MRTVHAKLSCASSHILLLCFNHFSTSTNFSCLATTFFDLITFLKTTESYFRRILGSFRTYELFDFFHLYELVRALTSSEKFVAGYLMTSAKYFAEMAFIYASAGDNPDRLSIPYSQP
jgi:hypothetical protein